MVEVTLTVADLEMKLPALVDSGSSSTIVPGQLLAESGLPYEALGEDSSSAEGAGGVVGFKIGRGRIDWQGMPFTTSFAVAEPDKLPVALLGRDDFFRKFVVCFDWAQPNAFMDIDPRSA